jgi:hypothetical protein
MRKGFSTLFLLSILSVGVATTSCDTYSYPTPQPDKAQMKGNEYVYGDVGGPAKQSKNTYPTNPDAAANALNIKKKLYADDPGGYSKWNSTKAPAVVGPASAAATPPPAASATGAAAKPAENQPKAK